MLNVDDSTDLVSDSIDDPIIYASVLNADQRGGTTAISGKPSYTVAQAAAQIDREGLSWSSTLGKAATVTYSFLSSATTLPSGATGFSQFNAAQITAAEAALKSWSDVANITFTRVNDAGSPYSNSGKITFGNFSGGIDAAGFASFPSRAGAGVWINSSYSYDTNPTLLDYGRQVLVHEIGHSLGLAHPGDYDSGTGNPTYATDAVYYEDSREYTVMSYWSETNTGGDFKGYYASAPLLDDIAAIQRLYGANMTTRTGDTVYGFNSNTGLDYYSATNASSKLIFAVWDAGGNDTFDFSGYSVAQHIDLNAGSFSDVGGLIGNVSIAMGVTIENAIGGSGADIITGNDAANMLYGGAGNDILYGGGGDDILIGGAGQDVMTGGAGNDIFRDTAANLNGDTITDLSVGDKINITDVTMAQSFGATAAGTGLSYHYLLNGSTITGAITLSTIPGGHLTVSADATSGIDIYFTVSASVHNDFNGDGRSDVLWRSDSGQISDWIAKANGGFTSNDANAFTSVGTNWHVVGSGDFNGDGRADILWRNDNGQLSDWLGTATGGFTSNDANAFTAVGTNWHVAGTGDFNGDGRADVLWRNDAGQLSDWLGTATGGFTSNDANAFTSVPTSWQVAGTGDFNGDGITDILWRNSNGQLSDWLGTSTGGFKSNDANALSSAPTSWHIVGTGDFNGDGRDDILWRSDTGQLSDWLGTATGGFVSNDANAFTSVPINWTVADTGDYNGDGRTDILWRSDTGAMSDWFGTSTGGFTNNDANAYSQVVTNWHIVPHDLLV